MSERIWYLKRCELFQRLSPQQLAQLESTCRIREFPRGSVIYAPSDRGETVLLLAAGRVKICTITGEGKQAILAFIEPGELFGELAVLEPSRREEYAEACERSTVVSAPADGIRQLIEQQPDMAIGITKLIGLRRKRVERRLKNVLFHSNRERLVHTLLDLAEQYGFATDRGTELRIKLSHQDLASIIGSTRETVTIVLGELQTERHVRIGRRKITLTDPQRLAQSIHASYSAAGENGEQRKPRFAGSQPAGQSEKARRM